MSGVFFLGVLNVNLVNGAFVEKKPFILIQSYLFLLLVLILWLVFLKFYLK